PFSIRRRRCQERAFPIYYVAMIVLSGADVILLDGVRRGATLVIDDGRIVEIVSGPRTGPGNGTRVDLTGHLIAPGFVDVHVHGVDGTDTLDSRDAVARIAGNLPKYGVTAFCPTTVAC